MKSHSEDVWMRFMYASFAICFAVVVVVAIVSGKNILVVLAGIAGIIANALGFIYRHNILIKGSHYPILSFISTVFLALSFILVTASLLLQ